MGWLFAFLLGLACCRQDTEDNRPSFLEWLFSEEPDETRINQARTNEIRQLQSDLNKLREELSDDYQI
jgi:hypothetical protein